MPTQSVKGQKSRRIKDIQNICKHDHVKQVGTTATGNHPIMFCEDCGKQGMKYENNFIEWR